jgi:hypothetical protein
VSDLHEQVRLGSRDEETSRAKAARLPDRQARILMFNVTFFGTLSWLGSGAQAADSGDWWHRVGQLPLMLAGLVLFWMGWWHADRGRDRQALIAYGPAVAILSAWITSVHGAVF